MSLFLAVCCLYTTISNSNPNANPNTNHNPKHIYNPNLNPNHHPYPYTLTLRVVFVGGSRGTSPSLDLTFPTTGLSENLAGIERGRGGKGEREGCGRPPALLPPTGFCLKYHPAYPYPNTNPNPNRNPTVITDPQIGPIDPQIVTVQIRPAPDFVACHSRRRICCSQLLVNRI